MTVHRRRVALAGEDWAERYLRTAGLRIVVRNWRCRLGELDLVALDGSTVVFAEVKTRRSKRFGAPAEAVDTRKQSRLARVAAAFLQFRGWEHHPCRFDVLAVEPGPGGGEPWSVTWLRDAFRP